eukprot:TRINITY_DN10628_c0_g2_i3.p3 TRINITY_DN10628_c0_g2~~TRINITY_DN10628_c0_g2_i3.p3  ORF type:complete len:143 (+),score=27.33 TRINITY_DN10628_c0_g2_i3:1648-2076(+)
MILRTMFSLAELVADDDGDIAQDLKQTRLYRFFNGSEDIQRQCIVSLYEAKPVVEVSQAIVSVFNTSLYILYQLQQRRQLAATMQWLVDQHPKTAHNIRSFAVFWRLHYPSRPRDLESLKISCALEAKDWLGVIDQVSDLCA